MHRGWPRFRSLPHHVRIEPNAAPLPFLIDPLHFVVEAGVPIERLLECEKVIQYASSAIERIGDFHHVALGGELLEQLLRLHIVGIDDRDDLQQLLETESELSVP